MMPNAKPRPDMTTPRLIPIGELPRCVNCERPMYRNGADLDHIKPLYPFRGRHGRDCSQLGAVDWAGLNRDYGWQSAWMPELCRVCDRNHDHRVTPRIPGLLRRLLRRHG